jgi:peptidoglycan/xylan/chitin deacetylase (PgdA/CDA1 family)
MVYKKLAGLFLRSMPGVIWRKNSQNQRLVLTFDDGPDPAVTPRILEMLDRFKIPAVFFLSGARIEKNSKELTHINYGPHIIGNHGYRHCPFIGSSSSKYRKDIKKTDDLIRKYFRRDTIFFRPPYGIWGPGLEKVLESKQKKLVLWSLMANDFKWPPQKVYNFLCDNLEKGDIIVFHDGEKYQETVLDVLPRFIEHCLSRNFRFEGLEEVKIKANIRG